MAYIRKYRDNWRAEVQRNGERSSGVFATKREAQAWAIQQEARAKRAKSSGGHTWQDAVDKYLAEVSSKKNGEAWERRRLLAARDFFGDAAPMAEIDAPAIARMVKKPVRANSRSNATALTATAANPSQAAQPSAGSRSPRSTRSKRPAQPDLDTNSTAPKPLS